MVDEFILRHHGKKAVRYLVPEMKEILNNTYGIIVYQEQIMQLAQKLAGYTLSEADLMRRAMGKKKREEMAVHEEKFITGAVERGIKQEKAEKIFSQSGTGRLVIISCEDWDGTAWRSNVVTIAAPVR